MSSCTLHGQRWLKINNQHVIFLTYAKGKFGFCSPWELEFFLFLAYVAGILQATIIKLYCHKDIPHALITLKILKKNSSNDQVWAVLYLWYYIHIPWDTRSHYDIILSTVTFSHPAP